jgi:hypothetical protein
MYFCVLCIVCFVTFPVLFVCIYVLNNCQRVAIQLQLNIYHIISNGIIVYTTVHMVEEVIIFQCVSVASRCLQILPIPPCNSECVVRTLIGVHCFLCSLYVPEILILASSCFCDV